MHVGICAFALKDDLFTGESTSGIHKKKFKIVFAHYAVFGWLLCNRDINARTYANFYTIANNNSNIHSNLNHNAYAYTNWRRLRQIYLHL